jgi:hypothetical protein
MEQPAQPISKEAFQERVLKAKQVYLDALDQLKSLKGLDELGQKGSSG